MKLIEKLKKEKILIVVYVILSIVFVIPSILYLIENKTLYKFSQWFNFFLEDNTEAGLQTLTYITIILAITFFYIAIIKNRNKIFKSIKSILVYVAVVGFIYVFAIPFTCSDVFYYMGVGRIDATYNQNPYYSTMRQYVNENKENIEELQNDKVLMQGYINVWGDTTVIYGPIWQLTCKVVGFLSFGNLEMGLLIFKLLNLLIHIINCYIIYKMTGKKIFSLIYGLNPFVLIEGIMCVHNDIFVVMFILLAIFFMKNKKKLWISMICLALATAIKYFSILLLPFIIIYYFRKETTFKRFIKGIEYGSIFVISMVIPYLMYIKDISVFAGMGEQQTKIAKSIYIPITEFFNNVSIGELSTILLACFAIFYFFTCLVILFKPNIKMKDIVNRYTIYLLIFIFVLITQFQPWYLMWLMPIFMWQKPNTVRVLVAMGIIAEFANFVFLLNGEGYKNGTPFIIVLYIGILAYALYLEKRSNKNKIKCFMEHI